MSTAEETPTMPDIKMTLPGPKVQALIERDKKVISPSYTRGYPFAIARGDGATVTDLDGNVFLDYCAGIAVCSTGHSHPDVVSAIQEQAAKFLHMSGTDFYYDSMVSLAERLSANTPGGDKRVFFCNSGAEAVEGALKLARSHTGRQNIISFFRSFHGRTYGAMSVTASKSIQRKHFSPLVPGVFHANYPYHYRFPMGDSPEATGDACLKYIEEHLFSTVCRPEDTAAILVEPLQGEGGYVVPPDNFLLGLQAIGEKYGIMIIADEVQAGVGRTGKMWASLHTPGFEPDIMTSAKGLASGMPLGAIIAKADVMDWEPGMHATTFGGNPVACEAALKTMDLLEQGGVLENARAQGEYMMTQLKTLQQRVDVMGDVRGRGLMLGVEIVKDKQSKEKNAVLRDKIVDACFYEGLLILGCGENSIRFSPPLIITQAQTDRALSIFASVIEKLTSA